ncbi:MAG TPA: endo-1,4-beta-xylanase [Bacteroidota bacterium]|nr:endo-1,4-beta-xylanase [Bacteroidota bacterium]
MKSEFKIFTGRWLTLTLAMLLAAAGTSFAQPVTNGGFESSDTGTVTSVVGWFLQSATDVATPAVFQIVNTPTQSGNRALAVQINSLGTNDWDIQAVAESISVIPGRIYQYSVWAKAANAGAKADFTVGNESYSTEYHRIGAASIPTAWTNFTFTFTVNDGQSFIRAPILLSLTGNAGNTIYIDNMRIVDVNAATKPVIVEAESGQRGSNYPILTDGSVTYISVATNGTGFNPGGDTSRMVTYNVAFPDSGSFNLFARVRVGSGGFNDDSFLYGNGFGIKNDTATSDWITVNGIASGGFTDPAAFVDAAGSASTGVWKWINLTKNGYQSTAGQPFAVSQDSLTKTFQICGREDGLDIDKFAFGKSYLYFTVQNLDSVQAGSATLTQDTGAVWKGSPIASKQQKFVGNVLSSVGQIYSDFTNYWNQVTPGNAGKWGSVETSQGVYSWTTLDSMYHYAIAKGILFKEHNLIWGSQQPSFISSLDSATQLQEIKNWMQNVGQRYPQMSLCDVVNEPINTPPDGNSSRANYIKALGGTGTTGYDWIIKAYQLARQYMPSTAKLLINEYNVLGSTTNANTYTTIINLLKSQGLVDGIGIQCHYFEFQSYQGASSSYMYDLNTIKSNLSKLGGLGLPIYISEMDVNESSDSIQLASYQKYFPLLYTNSAVKGITLWGYVQDDMWQTNAFLVHSSTFTERPAMTWMRKYLDTVNIPVTGISTTEQLTPTAYKLYNNYPNPFNPTTRIDYNLPTTSKVSLKIYDVLGREVQTLVNSIQAPGKYSVTLNAQGLSSGIYFYRLNAGSFSETKKLMLLK